MVVEAQEVVLIFVRLFAFLGFIAPQKTPVPVAIDPSGRVQSSSTAINPGQYRRKGVPNAIVMLFVFAIFATMAIPAYSFDSTTSAGAAVDSARIFDQNHAQTVAIGTTVDALALSRDSYSTTSGAEIRQAAAAAQLAAQAVTRMTSYAKSFSGPSVAQLLSNPPHPNFSLSSVFSVASGYQGVPYVYGGATPAGFDCSGFVMYVYAQFGIALPHSSAGQGASGTRISLADAQPGDLVVMSGHDGIYAGNGNILHAPYEGAGVRIQPIWTNSYSIVRLGI